MLHIEQIPRDWHNWIRTLQRFGEFRFVADIQTVFAIAGKYTDKTASFQNPVYISAL
ncbi:MULTISPECIES: hypothetical protein [Paraburkholderia]|uniref:Uncharacterized protein n=1 Tax=Paraburkholderia youngii TaxID=2782701 RepID=A0A7Y6JYB9_9BURK|nr:hypothetical protein [Paraburkholderia youngii]NUY00135.1 hypothetical protein [Paraburkholderia youngii]